MPGVVIPEADVPPESFDSDPALVQVRVFETTFRLTVSQSNNTIFLHTWGNLDCCLSKRTRTAYLYVLADGPGERQASLPSLSDGDFLLLEEVMGPKTGARADADPMHRQVVQLEGVPLMTNDPAYRDMLTSDGELQVFRERRHTAAVASSDVATPGRSPVSVVSVGAHPRPGPAAERVGRARKHRSCRPWSHDPGGGHAGDAGARGQDIPIPAAQGPSDDAVPAGHGQL